MGGGIDGERGGGIIWVVCYKKSWRLAGGWPTSHHFKFVILKHFKYLSIFSLRPIIFRDKIYCAFRRLSRRLNVCIIVAVIRDRGKAAMLDAKKWHRKTPSTEIWQARPMSHLWHHFRFAPYKTGLNRPCVGWVAMPSCAL